MVKKRRQFEVSRWACWPEPEARDEKPDLGFVPPLLRRRLSGLAGSALAVAGKCLDERRGIPVVLASRHGELARTAAILADLADRQPPSPTAFSLSVHNSATGLLGLLRRDRAASTAIAAGELTLAMGLLEAVVQAADADGMALLIHAEERPPSPYAEILPASTGGFALAMLVTVGGGRFSLAPATAGGRIPVDQPGALAALMREETDQAILGDSGLAWRVTRHAAAA